MVTRPGYRADIDGLRAIAVLAVLFFHAGLSFPGGYVGVDVFFVISGFLITRLIVADLERGTFRFQNFWMRRLRRIWPAATVVTLATVAAGAVLLDPRSYETLARDAIAQACMVANIRFWQTTDYFAVNSDLRGLLHTWSLAVEEQFYLVHPFVVVLLWKIRRGLLLPAFAVAALVSFVLSVLTLRAYPEATFYLLPTRAWELLLGGMLALAPAWRVGRAAAATAGVAGLGLVAVPMFVYTRGTPFPGAAALAPCLGTCLLIFAGGRRESWIAGVLSWEPLRRIGLVSYSLYLVHWPLLAMARAWSWPDEPALGVRLAVVPVSFVLAYVSWRFVENRFRASKPGTGFGRVVVASFAAAALTVVICLAIVKSDGWRGRFGERVMAHIDPERVDRAWQNNATDAGRVEDLLTPIGREGDDPVFLLWGDSHGIAISPVIDRLGKELGICGRARLRPGTTPVPGLWSSSGGLGAAAANERVATWAIEHGVRHVLLVARWTVQVNGRPNGPHDARDKTVVRTVDGAGGEDALALLTGGIERLAERLGGEGITLWVFLEVPRQRTTPVQRGMRAHLLRRALPSEGITRGMHEADIARVRAGFEAIASPNVRLVDLSEPFFASTDGVSPLIDWEGRPLYADDDHVNPLGAELLLTDLLTEVMLDVRGD
ncbi:MAG: acyltransferase [Planctomycetota bacterium]|nr:MAG: acyltransferase [Planctomycetota bacterium]